MPLSEAQLFGHFDRLWSELPRIREIASEIESPNSIDDRLVKLAIAGYSCHQPTTNWGRQEFDFVALRRQEVADFDEPWIEFVCLASGYLLGLCGAGLCNGSDSLKYELLLPGYMWRYSERFTT